MIRISRVTVAIAVWLIAGGCGIQSPPLPPHATYQARQCEWAKQEPNQQPGRQVAYVSADPHLNSLQEFFYPTLEANKKEFSGKGSVKGFGAGSSYPQIWLRDSATIIPVSRYYYPLEYLTSWLEEHLSYQKADGQLYDWIASGEAKNFRDSAPLVKEVYKSGTPRTQAITISADKNTTEADQETSAVDAAYQIFKTTGDRDWLNKNISGRKLIDRLNLSINYLLTKRFDPARGLVVNALTADWGDVSPVHPDQRAIYLDKSTPLVVGIYTNALCYRAAKQLEELNLALGIERMASYWKTKAALIKNNFNRHLWQEEKGFYRIHLILTPDLVPTPHDASNMFAMGGNGLAVLHGLADGKQAQRIFDVAAQRKIDYGLSSIGGVLLPPYPKGYFKHPAVSEEFFYQNGGQWDWFAGRFLLAEFEKGYSERAYRELVAVAKKNVEGKGLYEWATRTGEGKGSGEYAGSAGALGAAIFQGLFGVYLSKDSLNLKIRLGDQSGQIRLYEPATQRQLAYQYCHEKGRSTIRVGYESNVPNSGRIYLLLPKNRKAEELQLDGKKVDFGTEVIGEDTYIFLDTDWRLHRLQLKIAP